jgi:ACS family tartrate transporter-like MFS transporter
VRQGAILSTFVAAWAPVQSISSCKKNWVFMAAIEPIPAPTSLPLDDTIGRSALRKASLRLIPLIALGYGTAYMDRVNVSFASLQMNRDLHFSASMYGFGAGLFFLSYAACEVPSNLMLFRFGARRWLARIMFTWGLLAMGMMFVKTPTQFYIMRFLLGMAEAGFFPGVVFYLMQWFPAEMRARTLSRFYISLPLSSAVMGALAGALLNLQGKLGLAGWQWLFVVEGIPPIVLSAVFLVKLPDNPANARWLTEEERTWLQNQLKKDTDSHVHDAGVARALLDPRVWLIGMLHFCLIATAYAYTFSAPAILLKVTGLSITKVGFITAGMGLLGALCMLGGAAHADRTKEHYWHIAIPCVLMAGSYLVVGLATTPSVVFIAILFAVVSYYLLQGSAWTIPFSFLKGKSAAAGIAAVGSIAIVGGFVGPYWMGLVKDHTGSYQPGLLSLTVPCLTGAVIILVLRRIAQRPKHPAK